MRNFKELTDELFNELIKEDKWIALIADPTDHCDAGFRHKFYATCSYPTEYIVTDAQIAKARQIREERRQEILSSIKKGDFVLRSMGGSFASSKYEDGIGNHRVRCYFKNKDGRKFFIELLGGDKDEDSFLVEYSIDEDLREKREKEFLLEIEKREAQKGRWHIEEKQDYYCAAGIRSMEKQNIPYTFSSIVNFINKKYDCNYKTAKKIDYLVKYEEYCCEC